MIKPDYLDQFRFEANKPEYLKLKDKVKDYIESRYTISSKSPISVYSIRVGFQMVIGNIPQAALAYWLEEWGYRVEPCRNDGRENHSVFLKPKSILPDTDEEHYRKEWAGKRKGTVVY